MKLRIIILFLALFSAAALAAGDDSAPALLAAGRADDAITYSALQNQHLAQRRRSP